MRPIKGISSYKKYVLLFLLGLFGVSSQAQSKVDLALSSSVTAVTKMGDVATFTITLDNKGTAKASDVRVRIRFLQDRLSVKAATSNPASGSSFATNVWTIPAAEANAKHVLTVTSDVANTGISFMEAEVMSYAESTQPTADTNSTPGNGRYDEDDYTVMYVSIPQFFDFTGNKTLLMEAPAAVSDIKWFKNGVEDTNVANQLAKNAYIVREPGKYYFTGKIGNCAVTNDCNNGVQAILEISPVATRKPNSVGIAKKASVKIKTLSPLVFTADITLKIKNYGLNKIDQLQVTDDLRETFSGATITTNPVPVKSSNASVKPKTTYNGTTEISLLDQATSSLAIGDSTSLTFSVEVNASKANKTSFSNNAIARAYDTSGTEVAVDLESFDGDNPDGDKNGDPTNDAKRTPIGGEVTNASLGIAKSATVIKEGTLSRVKNILYVKNFSDKQICNVKIADSLATYFKGTDYQVVANSLKGFPDGRTTGLSLNPNFSRTEPNLLNNASSSTNCIAAGATEALQFDMTITKEGSYQNTAYASGMIVGTTDALLDKSLDVTGKTDITTAFTSPIGDAATPIAIGKTELPTTVMIPNAFTPNGDGINDKFIIDKPVGVNVNMDVYNRWGHHVYSSALLGEVYNNDWAGEANVGTFLGTDKKLPAGTYYYVVIDSNAKRYVRYFNLVR